MKLSDYAKQVGVTYITVYQWWKAGQLDASQLPTGTSIVREATPSATGVALSAHVSAAEQKADVTRQLHRLREYAAARGYQVVSEVTEIASSLNDGRPKRTKPLTDAPVGVIVVEHRDRLTRFGYGYIATLLEHAGRRVEAIYPSDTDTDLVDDFVAVSQASDDGGGFGVCCRSKGQRSDTLAQRPRYVDLDHLRKNPHTQLATWRRPPRCVIVAAETLGHSSHLARSPSPGA